MKTFKKTVMTALLFSSLLGCGSSADSAADFVESGKALLSDGNVEKARLEFKNAIQIDPRQAEPFYQLALIDEKQQKWKGMLANLTTVERLDPTHYKAIVKLGQIYLLSGRFDTALEKANKVIEADSVNVQAWLLKASVELKQGSNNAAMSDAEHALKLDPSNIEVLSLKALILNKEGESEQALAVIDKALYIKPEHLPLIMIKLSILDEQKDFLAMEKIYREQLKVHPDDRWIAISLAKLLNSQDRYEQAKKVLEEFVSSHPEDKQAKTLLVSLVKTKEPEQAIVLLDTYIEQSPRDFTFRFAMVKLQLDNQKVTDAVASLREIQQLDPDGSDGRKAQVMLAGYELQQGNIEKSNIDVDKILVEEPENEGALLLKSRLQIINKDLDAAITNLRVLLRNNPESDQALVLIAEAYANSGSFDLADDSFREALTVNPGNTTAALSVANNLMETKSLDRTEEVLVKALETASDKEPLLQALAQVRILKKDWNGTENIVDTLRTDTTETATTHFLTGQVQQGQEKYDSAIVEYKTALSISPSMTRALQGLAVSYIQLGKTSDLVDYLNGFIVKNPELLSGYGILAKVYKQSGDVSSALLAIDRGIAKEPKWEGGYSTLASLYLEENKINDAILSYQRGIDVNKNSILLRLQQASVYESNSEFTVAKKIYEDILVINPDVIPAINNLASLLTDHFATKENISKAVQLSERFKSETEPYYLDTYAWSQTLEGNLDNAQGILERITSLAPDVAVFNYHLGALYLKQGNKLEAENYLKKAVILAGKQTDKETAKRASKLLEDI